MEKKLFKKSGEIHFGLNAPKGFVKAEKKDTIESLKTDKKLWRCSVCNDLHIGNIPLHQCPTCFAIEAYVEISEKELKTILKI